MLEKRKKEVSNIITSSKITKIQETETILPAIDSTNPPSSKLCIWLQQKLRTQRVPCGNFIEYLRQHQTIEDLMVLSVGTEHWVPLETLFSESPAQMHKEVVQLVQTAFSLLDRAATATKASHQSSFWWQVMAAMRDRSIHLSPSAQILKSDLCSYLLQLLGKELLQWCSEALRSGEITSAEISFSTVSQITKLPEQVDWKTVGMDLNTFVGYSLFSVNKKYGTYGTLGKGEINEDKYWILLDMIAKEEDICENKEYLENHYDQYFRILNGGGLTLVSPRYSKLFHNILFEVAKKVNVYAINTEKSEVMKKARAEIWATLPGRAKLLAEDHLKGLPLNNAKVSCLDLLQEIVTKLFNSKANSILKRYYSTYLARGGKKSSRSTQRELRKHEGLGKKAPKPKK